MKQNEYMINIIVDIKNKIEDEIKKINLLYDKALDDMSLFFKKENEIKDKLENEVTKVKEQLEKNLSLLNEEIRINERLNKGINKLKNDKNQENNIFRLLTYISEINKHYKKLQILSKKPIKI